MDLKFEGLYLIHIRECILNNINVYKIGRSDNIYTRIHQYPNASIAYLVVQCSDSKKHEKELLKLFCSKYQQRKFYGEEYFEGDKQLMMNDIVKYILEIDNEIKIIQEPIKIYKYNENDVYILPQYRDANNLAINNNSNSNFDNDDNDDNDDNNDKKNNECLNCGIKFKFPCQLERHLSGKKTCKKITDNNLKCSYCNCAYSSKYSLLRHLKICKKNKSNEFNTIISNTLQNIDDNSIIIANANNTTLNIGDAVSNITSAINKLIDSNTNDSVNIIKDLATSLKNLTEYNNLLNN